MTEQNAMRKRLDVAGTLPADHERAVLVGRVWLPGRGGPVPVVVRGDELLDASALAPTVSQLFERRDAVAAIRAAAALPRVAALADALANADRRRRATRARRG